MSKVGPMAMASGRPLSASAVFWATRLALPLAIVVMELCFTLVQPLVLSPKNLLNILQQTSYLAVFATAQMVVILTRGFDLSLGTCVSAVSVASALIMTGIVGDDGSHLLLGLALGIAAGLGIGVAVGLFNGLCIARLHVNPFVATLGSLNICLGIATTISGGRPVFNVPDPFSTVFYSGTIIGIPVPVVIAAAICLAVYYLLEKVVLGRSLYILGSNPRAAKLAGIPSERYLTMAYLICSVLAAIGALLLTARTGSGEPNLGGGLMLESIAAAVIGGVSLQGGVGGIFSAVLGAFFITMLSNGMDLMRVDGYIQQIVLGGVIVAANFLDRVRTSRS